MEDKTKLQLIRKLVTDPFGFLPPRTRQVAQLTARGHTASEVGREMGIKVPTVNSHRRIIRQRVEHLPHLLPGYIFDQILEVIDD